MNSQDGYTLLSPSPHSQCAVVFSSNRITEVSGLLEYVASTTSYDHKQPYNDRSLINTGGVTTSSLKLDASQDSAQSQVKIMIILILQGFTLSIEL
jgi:hypothetical protein